MRLHGNQGCCLKGNFRLASGAQAGAVIEIPGDTERTRPATLAVTVLAVIVALNVACW